MKHTEPEIVTKKLLDELRRISPNDPDHLPREIELIEVLRQRHPKLPQVACFDTAFHQTMPRVAKLLPIPRRFDAKGIQRYGFHGLSYAYLMEELARLGDPAAKKGRVILAHLGNGASLAAVRDGKSMDTSMGFTPTAGLVMSTRSGDLDPGLAPYLARTEQMTTRQFYKMVNHESGLLGVSETSSDMRDLLDHEKRDVRAAEAVALFCYQAKKWIGSFAAALGGLDTLVFAGGIGENSPIVRARICEGLDFLGIKLDQATKREMRRYNFHERQSRHGARHSHGRRTDDCAFGFALLVRRHSRLNGPIIPIISIVWGVHPIVRCVQRGHFQGDAMSPSNSKFPMKTKTLSPELLHKMDAYWRAANYLSVGQIYLYDNPLLKRPLKLSDVKPLVVGHWGTTPGQNFIYVHLNRVIKKYDLNMFYVAGPGHGGPAIVGNVYLEGTWSEVYPNITQDEAGLKKLFTQFSFPGGISSHVAPTTPGSIHEGGELGYSLSHAFGAAFDNPDLIVACVVGDGEAETGPLATAWQSNKFLDPITDGAVLPILHLNGYKISNPTLLARIEPEELEQFFRGCGWTPYFVEGDEPEKMHELMAATLEKAIEDIRKIQKNARDKQDTTRPRWPMIVLKSPKGWTGPKEVDGLKVEGTFRAHQVPLLVDADTSPARQAT